MKKIIIATFLMATAQIIAQNNPEKEVEGVIKAFFEGFHKGDTLLMKQTMADELIFKPHSKARKIRMF